MKKLFLLDAYALIFRAYYALIRMPRITQAGFNTSAIFGFVNTLEELLRKENPTHIAVCFDPPTPTFRKKAYEEYKAERQETPEDIHLSIPIIKEIIKAYNIPAVEVDGYEADDVIGTLAKQAEKEGYTTYMMTPDKDYGQLVSPNVLQYKPSYRGQDFEIRGEEEICVRYGLQRPLQMIDYLALVGDKSDNIPGCPGIGEKQAKELLAKFGSIEDMLAHTDELKGAQKKKIEENADQIKFSKFLATICTDVPVDIKIDDLIKRPADRSKLFAIFKELEFKSLTERVAKRLDSIGNTAQRNTGLSLFDDSDFEDDPQRGDFGEQTATTGESCTLLNDIDYKAVTDMSGIEEMNRVLSESTRCGLYILADGENDVTSHWIGSAVAVESGKSYYVPSHYKEGVAAILDLMARRDLEKVSINAKRDQVIGRLHRNDDEDALVNYYDLSLAHYVMQPEMRHSLDSLAHTYLGIDATPYPGKTTSTRRGGKLQNSSDVDLETIGKWVCEQASISLCLYDPINREVNKSGMEKLLRDVELPLATVLADMELTGVRIDTSALHEAEKEMNRRLEAIEKETYEMAGEEFNIGSPSKVGEILFDKLKLDPKAKRTKTGQYSTSEDILEKLLPKHPIVSKIIEYRSLKKLLTTYLTALPASINSKTGRVHTNYNQTVTATGRISSSSPNLQNIPIRDEEGREIRRAFISEPGCVFLSADYSQIELRLLADFSQDEIMLDAFRHGKDIHAITASKIYHKNIDDVTSNERRHAKTANFGIVYGISAFGLSTRLGISRSDAKEIIDNYFLTFPTIKKYMSDSIEFARENGYVETKMGRRRILSDINSRNQVVRGYAERNAINAPLQGTAADIIKVAMIRIFNEIRERGLKSKMIMQVHDELNFNVPENEIGVMQEMVTRQMEKAYEGGVTLTTSVGIGSNWLDAH